MFMASVPRLLVLAGALLLGAPAAGASTAEVHERTLRLGDLDRTFTVYLPARRDARHDVLLVLHGGSGGSGARVRAFIGAELEALANEHGFVVVYPDGVDGSWNDCRAGASYGAKRRNVDDVGFVRAMVDRVAREFGADRRRVFVIGFSNGAHLAYRMALEAPDSVAGIAAFGANLPAAESFDCRESGAPVPAFIVNGTADPINPFDGGAVRLPDGTSLGRVRSARETLAYFGRLAGYRHPPVRTRVLERDPATGLAVERAGWDSGPTRIVLYTIHGGGHTIPSAAAQFPTFLGPVERRLSGVTEAVHFFLER